VILGGGLARAARGAPRVIRLAVRAGNRLQAKPYRFGGGHASFKDTAYDCSGAVSYVLHAAHQLVSPLDSTDLMSWGEAGPGSWITVYANPSHAFMTIGDLRLDTSGPGPSGPRWRTLPRLLDGFVARHPTGL
jgi:cell wall-associated NlpC family hydrolase